MTHLRKLLSLLLCLSTLCSVATAFDTSQDSKLLYLVNKSHALSESYVPELVELTGLSATSNGKRLRKEALDALYAMYGAMAAEGIQCNVISGYRSYAYQQQLVNDKVNKRVANGQNRETAYQQVIMSTAPAGCSEHQLGLAIDFSTGTSSSASFANTAAGTWLREHAWEYGFILRYLDVKMAFTGIMSEPWHYRYIGIPHAQIVHQNGWSYEEYITYLQTNGSYSLAVGEETYDIFWTQDTTAEFHNVIDISSDNAGGWIITTGTIANPLSRVVGHWSESSFLALQERGIVFQNSVFPQRTITRGDFAALCGLAMPSDPDTPLTRQEAAKLLAKTISDKSLAYLVYTDLDAISGSAFQSVQVCVASGIFSHAEGLAFRPADAMTWAEAATTVLRYLESCQK